MAIEDEHPEATKLYNAVIARSDAQTARAVARGVGLAANADDKDKADWVRHATAELERRFDRDAVKAIRRGCFCREEGRLDEMKAWLGGLYRESSSLAEFVDKVNAHGADWEMDGDVVVTKFLTCECYMVQGVDRLPDKTWCYCTEGYTRELFRHVFDREVHSELTQTIKTGAPFCIVKVWPA